MINTFVKLNSQLSKRQKCTLKTCNGFSLIIYLFKGFKEILFFPFLNFLLEALFWFWLKIQKFPQLLKATISLDIAYLKKYKE